MIPNRVLPPTITTETTGLCPKVQELHEEEAQWVNYDEDELFVKMQLADSIFDALLKDTVNTLTLINDKKAKRDTLSWQLPCLDFKIQPPAQS